MRNTVSLPILRAVLLMLGALALSTAAVPSARAADHGDTPLLIGLPRPDARLTDLFVFRRGDALVLIVAHDPAIPNGLASYVFPSDLKIDIYVDNHSRVVYDAAAGPPYGATVLDPDRIGPDVTFRVRADDQGRVRIQTSGFSADARSAMRTFIGLRDDPFIRTPRNGRNSHAIVIELPLAAIVGEDGTLLVWVNSQVEDLEGRIHDHLGLPLNSQFPENLELNSLRPRRHLRRAGLPPDVLIYNVDLPAAFPNGRELTDDVVDIVGRSLPGEDPENTENDLPFSDAFPYLAPPHP